MRKLFIVLVVVLIFSGAVNAAPFLVSDLPPASQMTITACEVRVDNVLVPAIQMICQQHSIDPNWVFVDVAQWDDGVAHIFEVRWYDGFDWSPWTDPRSAGDPAPPSHVAISPTQ